MIVLSEIIGYNKIQYLNVENHLKGKIKDPENINEDTDMGGLT